MAFREHEMLARPYRLAVVPSDPLAVYEDKGISWWLEGYFNPCGFFDEVYCLTPLETECRVTLGMSVMPTPPEEFAARVLALDVDVVRAYGGYWASDLACHHRVEGVPVVVSVHDTNPNLLHASVREADFVLAVSSAVRASLVGLGVDAARIFNFANRVDLDVFRPVEDPVARSAFLARFPGRYRILHVGRKTAQKNPDTLIQALALAGKDYVGLFVGPEDDSLYRQLAVDCGVADRCHFLGPVPNRELAAYYSFCDCMCTPSRWEGFGIVFIEALACRAVVVTSDIPPMNEYIESGVSGLLIRNYESAPALAEALHLACTDSSLRVTLQANARRAAAPFERRRIDGREASLYAHFLTARRRPSSAGLG
jgi:glycosyltransferase involved in cell wall biosynthesis